jgi:SAM-dependent methyltransferase
MSDYVDQNRAAWDARSAGYQARHAGHISPDRLAWGVWQLPEEEVRALPDVRGKDVLEMGCGACQWSIALARRGARTTGLDFSERQLAHARTLMAEAGVDFPLVQASAEHVPLPDASFDLVFADHGAFGFTDPHRSIPEAARVLRPGGMLVFSMNSPIVELCWGDDDEDPGDRLVRDYFTMRSIEAEGTVDFQLPYGEWIRVFATSGLCLEDLIELRPPADAVSTFRSERSREWARRWPMDQIWRLRKL